MSMVGNVPGAPSHARFPQLDGYRALAVTCVIITHVGFQSGATGRAPWGGVIARLDFGVTLFFLLSGFLLFRPIAVAHLATRPGPPAMPYLWRRALRILPAYWLAATAALLLLQENRSGPAGHWPVQLTLTQTYVWDGFVAGFTQVWSLGTEVAFYLFLPVFAFVVRGLPGRNPAQRLTAQLVVFGALVGTAIAWRAMTFESVNGGLQRYWLPAYIDWFALGMLLAATHSWRATDPEGNHRLGNLLHDLAASPGVCWVIGLSLFWVSTTRTAGPYDLTLPTAGQDLTKHLLYGAAAFFFLLPATLGEQHRGFAAHVWSSRPMRYAGTVSYGMFLWNMLVLEGARRLIGQPLFGGHFWLLLLLTWLATLTIASASWYAVERPLLGLRVLVPERRGQGPAGARRPVPAESAPAP